MVGLGYRKLRQSIVMMPSLSSSQVLGLQLGLCLLLFWMAETRPFWNILLVWSLMGLTALLHPYGDSGRPIKVGLGWFIPLIAAHFLTVLLFGGDPRFHFPIDPLLLLFGFMGTLLIAYHLLKKDLRLALLGVLVVTLRFL